MFHSFIECIALISLSMVAIETAYYYLTRYDRRKKVFQKPVDYIDSLFETVDVYDIRLFVAPPTDAFDETELQGLNN